MRLAVPDWGDLGLLMLGLAALVASVAVARALAELRAVAREWGKVAAAVREVVPSFREAAERARDAAAGFREAAGAASGAAAAVAGAAEGVRARAEQLARTLDAIAGAAEGAARTADSVRLVVGVVHKTALPLLIRMVGWRAGIVEGISYLLKGRRRKGG